VGVPDIDKVQMMNDYLTTCFNMHLGLIDTKSLHSKTIYCAHRLLQEVDETATHDLVRFLGTEMNLGTDRVFVHGARTDNGRVLADGGYAQTSYLHCEVINILNRDFFHLNDLNMSLLWRMLATTTHHCIGMHNDKISAMGSSMIACRGGGHYTGKFGFAPPPGGAGKGGPSTNSGVSNTYQALDKPNSVGGDYVVSHHAWMRAMNTTNSSSMRTFDNGQVGVLFGGHVGVACCCTTPRDPLHTAPST
jgi:hypothetical protein